MRQAIAIISLICIAALNSCKVDQICASYQSYFLLTPTPQPSNFSYQSSDSLPYHDTPDLFALVSEDGLPRKDLPSTQKDKNGLVKSEWALVKNWNKRIVPMEVIIPEVSDSILFSGDDIMFAETDVVDSVALDSARVAAHTVRYNNDQKFYNWYFRDKLVWAEDQAIENELAATALVEEVEAEPEKEKKKLFQKLFKKKETAEQDSIN